MTNVDSLQSLLLSEQAIPENALDSIALELDRLVHPKEWPDILDNLYRDLGWKYFNNKNYGSAYLAFEKSLQIAQKTRDSTQETYSTLAIGQLYMELKNHDQAEKHFNKGLILARIINERELLKYAFNCNIELEYGHNNYQIAESYAREALKRFENEPADMSFHFYNVIGLIYVHLNRYQEAQSNFLAALKAAEVRPEIDKGFIYGNLGTSFIGLQQPDSALFYFDKDVAWSLKRNYILSAFFGNIGRMEAFLLKNEQNPIRAAELLRLSDSLISVGNLVVKPADYVIQLQVLAQLPLPVQRVELEKMLLSSSAKAIKKSRDFNNEIRYLQQLAPAIQSQQLAQKDKETARKLRLTLWLSALTLLLLAIVITWIYFYKKRMLSSEKRMLLDANTHERAKVEDLEKQLEIKGFELASVNQKNALLQISVEFHQNRIEQATMSQDYLLSVKQKTINKLVQLVESLPELPSKHKHNVQLTLNELDQLEKAALHLVPTSNNNIDLEHHLQTTYPELTAEEMKILIYIRMNMSNTEIARLKSITIAGVNKSRNRIRKKLNLQPNEDLRDFLLNI
jgi:tetratricopeptide (TPR) repeat protein